MQKVTIMLPKALVREATQATGKGLTPTIREGLRQIMAAHACEQLRRMRGKVKFSLTAAQLREDRD